MIVLLKVQFPSERRQQLESKGMSTLLTKS